MQITINFWAVLVSAIVSMIIGSVWYGPLFGKKFMHLTGMDNMSPEKKAEMKKGMTMTYILQFISSLVMFYVLAWLMGSLNQMTMAGGFATAFWMWLGFVVPLKLSDALWGGKMPLFWMGIGNMLITLLAAGAVIGALH
ncbi:MAG TPA: DUF1761 domain-containing protein [Candidatus Paceibacterota bacterium]|jgi:hypothetical protein|nr:DUF1761 domain-containing protein [Candidatus Paceibacterota bacterium]